MEPVFKPVHILCVALCLVGISFRGYSEATTMLADYGIFLIIMIVGLQLYYAWVRYASVRNLEVLDSADRRFYMSFPQDLQHKAAIERRLQSLEHDSAGMVELFHPSPALRQLLGWIFWVAVTAAGLPLAVFVGTGSWSIVATSIGAFGLVATGYTWFRLRSLRHSIEVTPFGIAEVRLDGSRRWLAWAHYAGARAFPRSRQVRLYPRSGPGHLSFSYDTTRIVRLSELIIEHSPKADGLDAHPSDPPAAS